MIGFRLLLVLMFVVVAAYTVAVVADRGWTLFSVGLSDIAAIGWAGQFHVDFFSYLILSALWVAWRHQFNALGIMLGLIASVAGIMFFSVYLLVTSIQAKGDVRKILLGARAAAE